MDWDNRAFSGTFIFDPATAAYGGTNSAGTAQLSGDNYAMPEDLPWMLTTLKLPKGVVASGDDSVQFSSLIELIGATVSLRHRWSTCIRSRIPCH